MNSELEPKLRQFDQWAAAATRDHDGWESSFPDWEGLLRAAVKAMLCLELGGEEDPVLIARVWSLSEETEDLCEQVVANPSAYGRGLWRVFQEGDWKARWQIVSIADQVTGLGREMVLEGLRDGDSYVRRRALLILASLDPLGAKVAAAGFLDDSDAGTRKIAADLISGQYRG